MLALWVTLCMYLFWYIVKASTYESISLDDLAILWRFHKQEAGCKSSFIQDLLVKNDEVVGFRCGCGYEYLQKRLIMQKTKKSAYSYKLSLLKQENFTMENYDIIFRNIKRI